VLADVLRAPGLQILRAPVDRLDGDNLPVLDSGRLTAVVRHPVVSSLDTATREQVAAAVRLVVLAEERRAALDAQVRDLEAAQRRMVSAHDEQRSLTAALLHDDVVAPLGAATHVLEEAPAPSDPVAAGALGVALAQLRAATTELDEIVSAAGPARLGHGRLAGAIRAMAERSPENVDVRVMDEVAAAAEVETALFYVCAEALVNVHRHAQAGKAVVTLAAEGTSVSLAVSDDGVGGADPEQSGLMGLRDRVTVLGGRLRVDSRPGAGTTVSARLPLRTG